ncbi:MAG: hypothetical protein UHD09_09165, partial [Bifidobacterium sp.]|nr:hypothetical protein [Bifidobacterium sp.]
AAATAAPDPTLNDVTTTALANLTALQQQGGDGLITKDLTLSSEQRAAIDAAVADITAAGYQVSFTAVDMATGGALSEGGDVMRYSASSIKAPYIVALAQTGTIDLDKVAAGQAGDLTDLVTNTLTVSDNDSYATLVHRYGTDPFVKWKDGVGMADGQVGDYGDLDTLDLARMWTMTYDFLFADSPARGGTASASARAWLAKQMVGSLNSSIDESNYGNDLTVYSKASWINGDGGYYALNDGGIVVPSGASDLSDKPQGAVIAILSNACGRNDLLQPLAAALRDAVGTVPTTTADTTDGTAATTGGPTDGTAATTEGTTTEATDGADDGQGAALAWSER